MIRYEGSVKQETKGTYPGQPESVIQPAFLPV